MAFQSAAIERPVHMLGTRADLLQGVTDIRIHTVGLCTTLVKFWC